jgi:hypothetical protein
VETAGECGYKEGSALDLFVSLGSQEGIPYGSDAFSADSWGSGLAQGKTLEKI